MNKRQIWIVGEGLFAEAVSERLEADFELVRLQNSQALDLSGAKPGVVLSLSDRRDPDWEMNIQRETRAHGVPYLRAYLYVDRGFLGPWSFAEQEGCLQCAEIRMRNVHPNKPIWNAVSKAQQSESYRVAPKLWTVPFLDWFGELIAEELESFAAGRTLRFTQAVYAGYDGNLKGQIHHFLAHPQCPECSVVPDDSPELAEVRIESRLKSDPRSYRLPNPKLNRENLRKEFYDWRMGLIHHLYRETYSKFIPITGAELPLETENHTEIGFGRTVTFNDSELTSILEALERYAGMIPRGRKTVNFGSYQEFREHAIHPPQLGIHDPAQRAEPGFRYHPYDDDLKVGWVWAYSWRQQKSVLIPEQMVYYRLSQTTPDQPPVNRFVYETSNGCAMGGSLEEAIYYGLMEVIERDAFLVAWYNRLPLTEIDLEGVKDQNILLVKDRVEAMGYRLHLFDMTMESGIPSIWATLINPAEDAGVKTYTAAGAHADPEKAIMGAMVEVVTSMPIYEISLTPKRDEAEAMVNDPTLVQTMEDHVLLYSHPDTLPRYDFLFGEGRQVKSVRDLYANWYENTPPKDFSAELTDLMDRLLEHHQDILIIDETPPELEPLGIRAVKVIVQGMLTMSFGHQFRRIVMERVQQAPVTMGYRKEPIAPEEINLQPHPFP
ncbi:hypothetical protein CIG75_10990 [Tumebacillus algifaecis]|uniref:YcaO domain-containing protein n=1 Tax=Tumebacillus algifaecis TaxID=1214604 RepID=A0A223D1D0_9BACL|nr:TOMM precursor leader peptide-binding protein [Tumebacillus algifaecis]ASS75448.1 hypothetical protein CIG75_10990 [Tumebacillus algifaecis]